MNKYADQLELLKDNALNDLNRLINEHGEQSKLMDDDVECKCLPLTYRNYICNMAGCASLAEITTEGFINNDGFCLDHDVLDLDEFLKLIDAIVEKYDGEKKPEEPKENKEYFLFGEQAVKHLEDNDNDYQSLIDDDVDYTLYVVDKNQSNASAELLCAFVGFGDYICLTKEEYQLLDK